MYQCSKKNIGSFSVKPWMILWFTVKIKTLYQGNSTNQTTQYPCKRQLKPDESLTYELPFVNQYNFHFVDINKQCAFSENKTVDTKMSSNLP